MRIRQAVRGSHQPGAWRRLLPLAAAAGILVLPAAGLYAKSSEAVQSSAAYQKLNKKYQKLEAQMQQMAQEMQAMHQQQLKLQKQLKTQAAASPKNFAQSEKRIHRRIRDLIRRMNRESGRIDALESKNVRYIIAGDVNTQFINRSGSDSTFYADASPMIQVRVDKHMFANIAFDFYTQSGQAGGSEADIGAANINYLLNNYMTLGAGLITSPIGGIVGNYNTAPWNRWLVDSSLQDNLLPPNELGAWTRGGVPAPDNLGYFTYFLFVSQGPELIATGNNTAALNFGNWNPSAQNGKSIGGRVSYLPIPELELGYSFDYSEPSPSGAYSIASSDIQALDMNYYYLSRHIDGLFRFRAGWTWDQITQSYLNSPTQPLFGNMSNGGQVEAAYQPILSGIKYVKHIMAVLRYDQIYGPSGSAYPASDFEQRWSVGLDYWIHSNEVLKFEYEFDNLSHGQHGNDALLLQWAVGI